MEMLRFSVRGTFLELSLTTFSIVSEYRPCATQGCYMVCWLLVERLENWEVMNGRAPGFSVCPYPITILQVRLR
jgi:hypothetical protein